MTISPVGAPASAGGLLTGPVLAGPDTSLPLLADLGGALTAVGTLVVGGGFVVIGVIVLAILGGRRAGGAQRRRLGALTPLPELVTGLDGALLHADEAVRAADQERMFAEAEFGTATASRLGGSVDRARAELDAAYGARRAVEGLLAAGQEVSARREVETIRTRVARAVQELQEQTVQVGSLRDDARHASDRVRRARTRLDELSARVPTAESVVQAVVAENGPRATSSLGEGVPGARRLLDRARQGLESTGDGGGMLSGEQLQRLAGVEHALEDAATGLSAAESLPRTVESARRELDGALGILETSLVRARATRDEDPRLPQAVAVAEQVRTRAGSATGNAADGGDPVSLLAAVRAADAELQEVVAASRDRYDAERRAESEARERRTQAQAQAQPQLSDSYDPRIGDAARQAADARYGPFGAAGIFGAGTYDAYDASRPSGIAGPSGGSSDRSSSAAMLGAVLSELTAGAVEGAMRGGRGRSRRRF